MAKLLDDASWHIEDADSQHPELDPEAEADVSARFAYAGAHIALFCRWGLAKGFGSGVTSVAILNPEDGSIFQEDYSDDARLLIAGETSPSEFMETVFDWKLFSNAFSDEIVPFAETYCGAFRGLYDWDMNRAAKGDYSWRAEDCDFDDYCQLIDRRFTSYKKDGAKAVRRRNGLMRLFGLSGPPPANWRPN